MNIAKVSFTTPNQNCTPNKFCKNYACQAQQPSFGSENGSFSTTIGKGLKTLWKIIAKVFSKSCCG